MRTLVRGGWVVGFAEGTHTLIPDGVVVYEDDRIAYVGRRFDRRADAEIDARGKLVCPGFIDTHVHSGHRASHRLITDTGRPDFFGQPFLDISVPREGTRVGGDPRYARPTDADAEAGTRLLATFTIAEMLRNGITTFMEFGSQLRVQEALLGEVDRLGLRAYLGAGYDSGRWVGDEKGRLKRVVDEAAGVKEFESAVAFVRRVDGSVNGRVRGLLAPREVETCSLDLLRATRKAADELRLPIVTHAAYNIIEFYEIVREHRMTPVELMESVGLLGRDLTVGHGNLIADNGLMSYAGGRDLELMGRYGVTVSHCPVNIARRGRSLDSWAKYRAAGINLALGSDTYPRDLIMQMRVASYFGKVMSHNLSAASAAEVFEAATLGGARALGRTDLGRLTPGAKADIVVIDLETRDSLRFGPVRDPIKALVECGIGDDVATVIVDGAVRMRARIIPGVDLAAVRRAAQDAGEHVWGRVQEWDPLGTHGRADQPVVVSDYQGLIVHQGAAVEASVQRWLPSSPEPCRPHAHSGGRAHAERAKDAPPWHAGRAREDNPAQALRRQDRRRLRAPHRGRGARVPEEPCPGARRDRRTEDMARTGHCPMSV
jgi:5-methylthioadenosine/S-adenosylhomocysteine deaminase